MNKLGTVLANAWMKKTLVDLNGFSENEIPKNRDEAYKALNLFYEELDKKTVGWKIGAVAKEVQKEEGFDGPVPGKIFKETILPSNCSIKYSEIPYSNLECEYAFEIDQDVKIDGELLNKINNFKLYTSPDGMPGTFTEYTSAYTVVNNVITITAVPAQYTNIVVQLKILTGGYYGNNDAYGNVVEENYGGYGFVKVSDLVTNFLVGYVGAGKLIEKVKRTDIIFHVKRALQEFSYDTLQSIHSQEATIPDNLTLPLPQDYVCLLYTSPSPRDKRQ